MSKMSKGQRGARRSLILSENMPDEGNIPSKRVKLGEGSTRATVAQVDLDPKGKQTKKSRVNESNKVRIKVKEGRRMFDYSTELEDNQIIERNSQIASGSGSQSNKTRSNSKVRRQIVFDQSKKGGKNLRSNNLKTNASLNIMSSKTVAKGGGKQKTINTGNEQVSLPIVVTEGEDDLVDDVCHDDQFGDGINLDIEGGGAVSDEDDLELGTQELNDNGAGFEDQGNGKRGRVIPNTSQQTKNDINLDEAIMSDPRLEYLVEQAVERRVQKVIEARFQSGKGEREQSMIVASTSREPPVNKNRKSLASKTHVKSLQLVKSPSDTTIYAPALNLQVDGNSVVGQHIGETFGNKQPIVTHFIPQGNDFNQRIADFVENARSEVEKGDQGRMGTPRVNDNKEVSAVKRKSGSAVINAEKHKATVQAPTGNTNYQSMNEMTSQINLPMHQTLDTMPAQNAQVVNLPLLTQQDLLLDQNRQQQGLQQGFPNIGSGVSDDNFFHLTCYIDPSLIHKIEKGEYVELEKLLPKDKLNHNGGEDRLEWVQREGGTFLVPANRENKINGIRRWEQAFRVYATIYCGANPHRAKEIWQYIAVINTAVAAYSWDNVYHYDVTFRHLMAFNPHRSWAVTYNQMWNLAMRDLLPKTWFW